MGQHLRSCLIDHRLVAPRVVVMLVGVEDLCDLPTGVACHLEALRAIKGIDCKRLTGFATRDQVIEIAIRIGGPDLLDDQWMFSSLRGAVSGRLWSP